MKHCPGCGETKPAEEFHKRSASKDGLARECKPCRKAACADDYRRHRAARLIVRKAYRRAHPEVNRASGKRIYAAKPEQYRARNAARRARERQATQYPDDRGAIRAIYKLAMTCRRMGISCHVDHIVPLKGARVCGLHVSWNLRVIADDENQAKSNAFSVTDFSDLENSPCK